MTDEFLAILIIGGCAVFSALLLVLVYLAVLRIASDLAPKD